MADELLAEIDRLVARGTAAMDPTHLRNLRTAVLARLRGGGLTEQECRGYERRKEALEGFMRPSLRLSGAGSII